jgi:hypothetical protein
MPPYPLIQYLRFTAARKKVWKIKKIKSKFQNDRQARTGRNKVKSSSANAPSTWLIFLYPPYSRFPAELSSILLLPFSLFTLVATLSHCLCSESPYLSIKLYRIYVCYTNITLHIAEMETIKVIYSVRCYPCFHVTAVSLGTYYQ